MAAPGAACKDSLLHVGCAGCDRARLPGTVPGPRARVSLVFCGPLVLPLSATNTSSRTLCPWQAVKVAKVEKDLAEVIKACNSLLRVNFPLRRDDGSVEVRSCGKVGMGLARDSVVSDGGGACRKEKRWTDSLRLGVQGNVLAAASRLAFLHSVLSQL